MKCDSCGKDAELRPYGEGGARICFGCMKATPESEERAGRVFATLMGASEVVGEGVSVLGEDGPRPALPHERDLIPPASPTGEEAPRV